MAALSYAHRSPAAATQASTPAPAPTANQAQRPLRLTPPGRRVVRAARWMTCFAAVLAGAVLAVVLVSSLLAPGAVAGDWSAGSAVEAPPPGVEVVVAPGDTLWDLAQRHAPEQDPRDFVAEVYRINDLPESGLVRAGERLLLPGVDAHRP